MSPLNFSNNLDANNARSRDTSLKSKLQKTITISPRLILGILVTAPILFIFYSVTYLDTAGFEILWLPLLFLALLAIVFWPHKKSTQISPASKILLWIMRIIILVIFGWLMLSSADLNPLAYIGIFGFPVK